MNLELIFPMGSYSRQAHQDWLEQIDHSTLTLGTPTHFQDLITTLASESADVSPSYSCIIGGAKVKKQLWLDCQDQLKIEAPSIGYGATEASPGLTHLSPGEKPEMDGEIGRVLDHVQLEIHPSGLSFSGRNLCYGILEEGKWSHPRQYHLPDIVEGLNGSDKLLYLTRANWFLNRGGEKFSLEKIEKTIFDGLKLEALACALPDERLGEELGLLVLNKHGASQELKEKVISVLKEKTLRNFPIENIQFVEDWPYNDSMKKDRRKARRFFTKEN